MPPRRTRSPPAPTSVDFRLFLNFSAGGHLLAAIRIRDLVAGLDPILVQHWAMHDVIAGLSRRQFFRLFAQLFESDPRFFQRIARREGLAVSAKIGRGGPGLGPNIGSKRAPNFLVPSQKLFGIIG